MNNKEVFRDWLNKHHLITIDTTEFLERLEKIFYRYLRINIWYLEDKNSYNNYCEAMLNKEEINSNDYLFLKDNYRIYFDYLKIKESNIEFIVDPEIELKSKRKIEAFFENKKFSAIFERLYYYAYSKDNNLMIEIKDNEIYVKAKEEKYQFKCDKDGNFRVSELCHNVINETKLTEIFNYNIYAEIDRYIEYFNLIRSNGDVIESNEESIISQNDKSLKKEKLFYEYLVQDYQIKHMHDGKALHSEAYAKSMIAHGRILMDYLKQKDIECDIYMLNSTNEVIDQILNRLIELKSNFTKEEIKRNNFFVNKYLDFINI